MSLQESIQQLPPPFDGGKFNLEKRGVHDCPDTSVYLSQEGDFAFLHPRPEVDYVAYKPRVRKLGLGRYKKSLKVVARRFDKVAPYFPGVHKVLEIGAGDGAFLAHVADVLPRLNLSCVEVDQNTRESRDAIPRLVQYAALEDVEGVGEQFDLVCAFHVLEHIFDPAAFLARCRACLAPEGRIVLEVPSLDDPLLSLYRCAAYRDFYFQRQHPYVYSARSLTRMLEHLGLRVFDVVHHQRYGLENHLQWLSKGEPGGNESLRELFGGIEADYTRSLEAAGRCDAVIVIAGEPT